MVESLFWFVIMFITKLTIVQYSFRGKPATITRMVKKWMSLEIPESNYLLCNITRVKFYFFGQPATGNLHLSDGGRSSSSGRQHFRSQQIFNLIRQS
jgi:hypothetical protein